MAGRMAHGRDSCHTGCQLRVTIKQLYLTLHRHQLTLRKGAPIRNMFLEHVTNRHADGIWHARPELPFIPPQHVARIRECCPLVGVESSTDVIGVTMRQEDGVDGGWIDS